MRDHLRAARERGAEFVLLSPTRDDLAGFVTAEWLALVPGTDVAVMLALAFTLLDEELLDRAFLARYTVGFDRFERYLRGTGTAARRRPSGPRACRGFRRKACGRSPGAWRRSAR